MHRGRSPNRSNNSQGVEENLTWQPVMTGCRSAQNAAIYVLHDTMHLISKQAEEALELPRPISDPDKNVMRVNQGNSTEP
jgi:hypothetical protein